jgi:hypothetical protein
MKIKGIVHQEIEINDYEQQRIAMAWLYKKFDWDSTYFIENEMVRENVPYHVEINYDVRKATKDDIAFDEFLKFLRRKQYEKN